MAFIATLTVSITPPKFRIRFGDRSLAADAKADPDDSFLCSYPKSGNTWLRFLLARLMRPETVIDFYNVGDVIPDIYPLNKSELDSLPRPRLLKSHEAFRSDYARTVYLYRDPRDVLLSYYFFSLRQGYVDGGMMLEEFAGIFIHGGDLTRRYGTWAENISSWFGARGKNPGFHSVSYEALFENPFGELGAIARFLEIPFTAASLKSAISASTAGRMRDLHRRDGDPWAGKVVRKDIPFVRKAQPGAWRTDLPANLAREVEAQWRGPMRQLGYLD